MNTNINIMKERYTQLKITNKTTANMRVTLLELPKKTSVCKTLFKTLRLDTRKYKIMCAVFYRGLVLFEAADLLRRVVGSR